MEYESYWDMLVDELLNGNDKGVLLLTSSDDFDMAVSVQVLNSKGIIEIDEEGVEIIGVSVSLFKKDKKIKEKFLKKVSEVSSAQLCYMSLETIEKYKDDWKEILESVVKEHADNARSLCVVATNNYVDETDLSRIYQVWEEEGRPDGIVMYDEILYLIGEIPDLQDEEVLNSFVEKRFKNIEFFKKLIVIQQSELY